MEAAIEYLKKNSDPCVEAINDKLNATMQILQAVRFGNGDLWLDNQIIRNRQLVGVIDFENAGFSDSIYIGISWSRVVRRTYSVVGPVGRTHQCAYA